MLIVISGFIIAGFLITKSYDEWQSSPITTTITTHPLDNLDFPNVTVCPPKGSNTALNYDLMKVNDESFSNETRNQLKGFVWEKFVSDPHLVYVEEMLELVNPSSLKQIYDGYQSVPKPYGSSRGFQITFETLSGSLQTPRFGEPYKERDFAQNKDLYCLINLPLPTRKLGFSLRNWTLVIELEVNVNDIREVVEIRKGPKYVLYRQKRNWKDAEEQCQKETGGHLASIQSEKENHQVAEMLKESRYDKKAVWIGARRNKNRNYEWSDGNEMNFTNWVSEFTSECGFIAKGGWSRQGCVRIYPFVCKLPARRIMTKQIVSLQYNKDELISSQLSILYKHNSDGNPQSTENRTTTGFKLRWHLKDGSGLRVTNISQHSTHKKNQNIRMMINLATRARAENMTEDEIIKKTIEAKYEMGLRKTEMIDYDGCINGQIVVSRGRNPFEEIELGLPSSAATYQGNITTEDHVTGFKIYSILTFCNPETLKLGKFLNDIVSKENLRTILKAVVNTIDVEKVREFGNRDLLFGFYQHLEKTFNLQLGKILLSVSSPLELKAMLMKKLPYITPFSNEIEACLTYKDCKSLQELVNSLGKL